MIDKPMLILPLPDGFKSSSGLSPLTVLIVVGFFIYLDQRYGFTSSTTSSNSKLDSVIEQPPPKIVKPPYEQDTQSVPQPLPKTISISRVPYISIDEEGDTTRIVEPEEEYWLVVTTDNARIRSKPERNNQNALGMLDLYEKVLYKGISDFTESFRRNNGETVDGYWFYVFRPKTNSYGWIHEINLSPYKE